MQPDRPYPDWSRTPAAIWRSGQGILKPVRRPDPVRFSDLLGIDRQREALAANTARFLQGAPANHVLLWGGRGTGKSTLVRTLLNEFASSRLRMVQIDRDDLGDLPRLLDEIEGQPWRFIVYCDDLSFLPGDSGYRALRTAMEGSLELPPENVRLYATSNRRHLLPEYMVDNQQSRVVDGLLHHADQLEDTLALADRFGLSLSFPPIDQTAYLAMIDRLFSEGMASPETREGLHREACRFALERGGRSGRVALQFLQSRNEVGQPPPAA